MLRVRFYLKGSGRSSVKEFLAECSNEVEASFYEAVNQLEAGDMLAWPQSKSLASIHQGLYELRLKDAAGQYRFFYFIKNSEAIYFLHAFMKKTQKIPHLQIELILKRIKEV